MQLTINPYSSKYIKLSTYCQAHLVSRLNQGGWTGESSRHQLSKWSQTKQGQSPTRKPTWEACASSLQSNERRLTLPVNRRERDQQIDTITKLHKHKQAKTHTLLQQLKGFRMPQIRQFQIQRYDFVKYERLYPHRPGYPLLSHFSRRSGCRFSGKGLLFC